MVKVLLKTRQFNESPKVSYMKNADGSDATFPDFHSAELGFHAWLNDLTGESYETIEPTILEV